VSVFRVVLSGSVRPCSEGNSISAAAAARSARQFLLRGKLRNVEYFRFVRASVVVSRRLLKVVADQPT